MPTINAFRPVGHEEIFEDLSKWPQKGPAPLFERTDDGYCTMASALMAFG